MERSQVIPIIRTTGGSNGPTAGQWSENHQPQMPQGLNDTMVTAGHPWPGKDSTTIMTPGMPLQPMPMDINEQMRQMQENMQRMQAQMQANFNMGGVGAPPPPMGSNMAANMAGNMAPAPFPRMDLMPQPFPTLPAQDTQPQVDTQGFFRLTPLPAMGMNTPLDIPDVVVQCKDGSKKFLLKYDVSDFKPGEVKVEINGNQLKVSGNHEETSGNSVIRRTYHKEHPLPDGLKQDELRSVLSPEGVLTIQAPVVGDVPVGTQPTPMLAYNQPPQIQIPPAVQAHNYDNYNDYQQPSTLPRAEKRRVKFCEGDP